MYCSSCGSVVAQNLNYCNRCGAKVSGAKVDGIDKPVESPSEPLIINAIAAVFIVGLGAIIGLMAVMKKVVGFDPGIILAVTVFCFMLMLVVEGVLMRSLLKGKRDAREAGDTGDTGRLNEQTTKELGEAQAQMLSEPVPSVTEHTTRSFEPVYIERQSK